MSPQERLVQIRDQLVKWETSDNVTRETMIYVSDVRHLLSIIDKMPSAEEQAKAEGAIESMEGLGYAWTGKVWTP